MVALVRRRPSAPVAAVAGAGAMAVLLVAGPGFATAPTTVLLLLGYAGLAVALVDGRHLDRRLVLGLGAGLLVLAVARPPMQSHDLWSYVMYGRTVSHHHASPYLHPPDAFPGDSFVGRVDPLWRHATSVYGPLFTAWAALLTFLGGSVALLQRLGFQLTAALAVVVAVWLVDRRTGGDPRALALVLLNPLVVFSLVNDAHVDVLVGLGVLGAVLLLERRRPAWAGAVIGIAVLVKIIALLPAGAIGLWLLWRRDRWPAVAPFALALVLVVVPGYVVAGGRSALQPVFDSSSNVTGASVWTPPYRSTIDSLEQQGKAPADAKRESGKRWSRYASVAVLALTVLLAWFWAGDAVPVLVAGGALLTYALVGAYTYPWYAGGALFVLALRRRSPATWLLVAVAAVLQVAEIPGRQFTTYVDRAKRFPDPGWHRFFRAHGAPTIELVLAAGLVGYVAWSALRSRRAGGVDDVVGQEREQVD